LVIVVQWRCGATRNAIMTTLHITGSVP